ncbi:MAG: Holliday junction resolvase RuvX [Dehalococcoidales bacterium]|nr:Holliday junction resolvase RuvX [Dehalococcoidales bacterium]
MRSLGLDIGDRRIGVALSDPMGILANPLTIIHRQEEVADITAITNLIYQHQVEQVIVGLPRSMNGSLGQQAEKVTSFSQRLGSQIKIPLVFRDERLSTVSAQRLMRNTGIKKASYDDAIAAAIILQGYLDEKYHQWR